MQQQNCTVITVACQKGGVGKTTVSVKLAIFLAKQNKRVCIIDGDQQGNTTTNFISGEHDIKEFYDLISEYEPDNPNSLKPSDVTFQSDIDDNLFYIPTLMTRKLANVQPILATKEYVIGDIIDDLKNSFDFIIIDTAPNSSVLERYLIKTSNMIIPVTTSEIYSDFGLDQLFALLNELKRRGGLNIKCPFIILNKFVSNQTLDKDMQISLTEVSVQNGMKLFTIPRTQEINNLHNRGDHTNTKVTAIAILESIAQEVING